MICAKGTTVFVGGFGGKTRPCRKDSHRSGGEYGKGRLGGGRGSGKQRGARTFLPGGRLKKKKKKGGKRDCIQ